MGGNVENKCTADMCVLMAVEMALTGITKRVRLGFLGHLGCFFAGSQSSRVLLLFTILTNLAAAMYL